MLKATVKTGGRWPSVFCCLVLYGALWCSMALYGAPLHHVTRIIQDYRY